MSAPVANLSEAAKRLDDAASAIKEAVELLLNPDDAAGLRTLSKQLGEVAEQLQNGMMIKALRVPLIDRKIAARAMGSGTPSEKKLEGLKKARTALAEYRKDRVPLLARRRTGVAT